MRTIVFKNKVYLKCGYSMVGPMEGDGPIKRYFDNITTDDTYKEKTFELAERHMLKNLLTGVIKKSRTNQGDIDYFVGGDLLNQIVSSSYTARDFGFPFLGLYSACATMTESLMVGALLIDSGYANNVIAATCTHFSTAERQYRFPLELGNQRPPTAQWTITGGGASLLSNKASNVIVYATTIGRVIDFGVNDINNMGAAMAPAALDTIKTHLNSTNQKAEDFDLIITGDLGKLGSEILLDLLEHEGIKIGKNISDCGCIMYNKNQRVFMGGSGAGCSASILNSYIISKLQTGEFKKVLLVSTGALMSTTTSQQGDTIPGIAHAIELRRANDKSY